MQKTSKLSRDGAVWGLLMVAPTIIGLLVLNIWPFIETIYMSFSKSLPFGEFEFEGLDNYIEMFQNPEFWKATGNTILFCILTVPVGIFLALLVAVLLNSKIRVRTTFRAIFFLPMVVAPAAVAMVWKWIFNTQYGILNTAFGQDVGWLTDPHLVLLTCAVVQIWSNIGYDAVLLLAGLQNVSQTLYEAADLDGAGPIQRFFRVTLPLMVREGAVIPVGAVCDRPDYDFAAGVTLHVYELEVGETTFVSVPAQDGSAGASYAVTRTQDGVQVETDTDRPYAVVLHAGGHETRVR